MYSRPESKHPCGWTELIESKNLHVAGHEMPSIETHESLKPAYEYGLDALAYNIMLNNVYIFTLFIPFRKRLKAESAGYAKRCRILFSSP